jgi:hypothetical protein
LLLAIIAVAIAATLACSFLVSQRTTMGIARNIENHSKARYVAESGLELAIAHVRANETWRTDHPNGTWVTDEPFGAGTFTVVAEDGEDTDGDGTVDGDGDLPDDDSDPLTLTVTGKVGGTTHVVHAVVTPDCGEGPVTYQEFTEAKASTGTTAINVSTPGGTGEGDLLIAAVVVDGNQASSLSPSGGEAWTEVSAAQQGGVTLGVWWKLAAAVEAPAHQFTWSSSQESYAWIMRFIGHDPSDPINVSAVYGGGASSTPNSPPVTTTVENAMILRLGGFDDDDINVDDPGLSGHTGITMDRSGSGSGTCSGGAGYVSQGAAGSSGTFAFSLIWTQQYRTLTAAIKPDPNGCDGGNPSAYSVRWVEQP